MAAGVTLTLLPRPYDPVLTHQALRIDDGVIPNWRALRVILA
jgi:hypothetical protein